MQVNKLPILLCPDINHVWGLSAAQNAAKTIGIIELNTDEFILAVDTTFEQNPNIDCFYFRALGREYKPRIFKSRAEAEKAWNESKMSFSVCAAGKYGLRIVIKR